MNLHEFIAMGASGSFFAPVFMLTCCLRHGSLVVTSGPFLSAGFELTRVRQVGAIGHICGEFYTATGAPAPVDINERTISIGMAAIKKVPTVIAVAGGATKATAIVAGLRGGYFNTLITDDRAAQRMLRMTPVR